MPTDTPIPPSLASEFAELCSTDPVELLRMIRDYPADHPSRHVKQFQIVQSGNMHTAVLLHEPREGFSWTW